MSDIDRYLDELFNRLAGYGPVGRRALAEAEDHLRAAAASAVARGEPADQAERAAVARFGSPALVARQLRLAYGAGRFSTTLSVAWLLAGLAAAGFGVASLVAAGRLGWRFPGCVSFLARDCATVRPVASYVTDAAAAAAVGAVLLLCRWLAVRYSGLAPARRGFALGAGLLLALAAALAGTYGWTPGLGLNLLPDLGLSLVVRVTALTECVVVAVSLSDSRPRGQWPPRALHH